MQAVHRASSMTGVAGVETHLVASGPPLDYSFKELRSCAEIETEEPRSGVKRGGGPAVGSNESGKDPGAEADDAEGGATASGVLVARSMGSTGKPKKVMRLVTISIKLNNNMLDTLSGLQPSLESVMHSPIMNLQWIDLSFNQLTTIEPELLRFMNLKALYLHGNCIKNLSSVDRLKKLPKLLSLTLNGNPIESTRIYRVYVIGTLSSLRSLDHSTITADEVAGAASWIKGHIERAKKRAEERKFASMDED
mmetsp:Transcript_86968/g.221445  ORF Transcript_86968/g.221445 Transcript_86968/m.221445 type:complete len:251 (-) Transcript_86968:72-824(-)